jgi:two-component system, LytTR family, sensor kinase
MNTFFKRLFLSRYALHAVFWTLQIFSEALAQLTIYENDKAIFFLNLLSYHSLQIFICCFNVFFLIPHLYRSGKRTLYWIVVVILVITYSYAVTQLQQYFFKNYFETSETLSKTLYHFTLNTFSIIRYLVVTVFIAFAREWLLKTFLENEQKTERAKSEINFLRSQLNPHFLFNTLNNIYGLVLKQSPLAKEVILKLSDIMKYTLYESTQEKITLKEDVENVLNYISLEKLRQGNNAVIETCIDYQSGDQLVCPLLILPLVENAFKHGVNNTIHGGFFRLSLKADKEKLVVDIVNSKTNKRETNAEHAGIGLYNLNRRLSLFYPGKYSLESHDQPEVHTVKLTVDLL